MTKILFVCEGNIFRSMSAEYLMKKYLKDNNITNIEISSAGTNGNNNYVMWKEIKERLAHYNVEPKGHEKKQLTKEIAKDKDLIICMMKYHQEFVKNLGFDSILFKKVAFGKDEEILDDDDCRKKGIEFDKLELINGVIDTLHDGIPKIVEKVRNNT